MLHKLIHAFKIQAENETLPFSGVLLALEFWHCSGIQFCNNKLIITAKNNLFAVHN